MCFIAFPLTGLARGYERTGCCQHHPGSTFFPRVRALDFTCVPTARRFSFVVFLAPLQAQVQGRVVARDDAVYSQGAARLSCLCHEHGNRACVGKRLLAAQVVTRFARGRKVYIGCMCEVRCRRALLV